MVSQYRLNGTGNGAGSYELKGRFLGEACHAQQINLNSQSGSLGFCYCGPSNSAHSHCLSRIGNVSPSDPSLPSSCRRKLTCGVGKLLFSVQCREVYSIIPGETRDRKMFLQYLTLGFASLRSTQPELHLPCAYLPRSPAGRS